MVEMKNGEEVRSLLLVERGVGWGMATWWREEKGRRRGRGGTAKSIYFCILRCIILLLTEGTFEFRTSALKI